MNMRMLTVTFLLAAGTMVCAQENRTTSRGNRPAVPASLGAAMRDMGHALQRVQKEAADPAQKDAALADVILMQRDAAISKTATPPMLKDLTGDAKAKALSEYRADLSHLIRTLLDLEEAVGNQNTGAITTAEAQIQEIMKGGHAQFRPGDKH